MKFKPYVLATKGRFPELKSPPPPNPTAPNSKPHPLPPTPTPLVPLRHNNADFTNEKESLHRNHAVKNPFFLTILLCHKFCHPFIEDLTLPCHSSCTSED